MQHNYTQDTLVGLFVASGIAALFFMAMQISNLGSLQAKETYTIIAEFENSGGLKVKAPVGGVKIGRVSAINLDQKNFRSVVKMAIDPEYNQLPDDSSASIFTSGLLGEKYVNLAPGGSDTTLKNGSKLEITQSAVVLEELIGQFLFKDKGAPDKK
jgi:phospholipid/cholesterol/gamma-HCH transport system substrate-binding protein